MRFRASCACYDPSRVRPQPPSVHFETAARVLGWPHRPVTFRVVNLGDHEVADDKACAARNDLSRKAGVERAPIARFQRLVPAEALTLLPSLEETLSPPPGKSPRPPFPATRPIDWLRLTQ